MPTTAKERCSTLKVKDVIKTSQLVVGTRLKLKEEVLKQLSKGVTRLELDFAEVGDVDSSGLGTLVSLSKRMRLSDGTIVLLNLSNELRNLFELTRLNVFFEIV